MDYADEVDLVVLYDAQSPALADRGAAKVVFVRMARDLERLLQRPTADGATLRVDLRLRPEPSAKAVAIDVEAALLYYETFGQNWERAALVKARVVAGDRDLGAAFLAALSPFLWRRYFDFAAIADTLSIKRQITGVGGNGEVVVEGHDVKLGPGGLRDIELFVQTQQLIFGGKRPKLRGAGTMPMLRRLRREGWISDEAADDLTAAFGFLSRTHHRLQIAAERQSVALPRRRDALERFARFCGFASAARFVGIYEGHVRAVIRHCALLFETAPGLGSDAGDLVFTGVENDPATLRTLAKFGFKAPETVAATVRTWHSGLRAAVRSTRAREQLTDLVPKLLATFAHTSDPESAMAAFDRMLERLPAASELFAILAGNAVLRRLFGDILGSAPLLSDAVRRASTSSRRRDQPRHPDLLRRRHDGGSRRDHARPCDRDRRFPRRGARLPTRRAFSHRGRAALGRTRVRRGRTRLHGARRRRHPGGPSARARSVRGRAWCDSGLDPDDPRHGADSARAR